MYREMFVFYGEFAAGAKKVGFKGGYWGFGRDANRKIPNIFWKTNIIFIFNWILGRIPRRGQKREF